MKNGVLAGYPLDSLKVTLLDGSFHPVDSDQLSFEICANMAFKKASEKAGPALRERALFFCRYMLLVNVLCESYNVEIVVVRLFLLHIKRMNIL